MSESEETYEQALKSNDWRRIYAALKREECPSYPCHFAGQDCEWCYCPFYPCPICELIHVVKNEWKGDTIIDTSYFTNSCSNCSFPHIPEIARFLASCGIVDVVKLFAEKERKT